MACGGVNSVKKCPRCVKSKRADLFAKDSHRSDGLDAVCKACRKEFRQNNQHIERARKARQKLNPEHNKKRGVRTVTSRAWGNPRTFNCSVISCRNRAHEFHHMDYDKPDLVLPLCKKHHRKIHQGDK